MSTGTRDILAGLWGSLPVPAEFASPKFPLVNEGNDQDDRREQENPFAFSFSEQTLAQGDKMSLLGNLLGGLSFDDRELIEAATSLYMIRGQDRFTQAMHSLIYLGELKDSSIKTKVRGVAIVPQRQEALRRLAKVDQSLITLALEPEPENEVDPFALKVLVAFNGSAQFHLGYLSYDRSPFLKACQGVGITFTVSLLQITGGSDGKNWGMNIELTPVEDDRPF